MSENEAPLVETALKLYTTRDGDTRAIPDIRGTLWIDVGALSLRHLEFEYMAEGQPVQNGEATGFISFVSLPRGAVFVGEWRLRLPVLEPPRVVASPDGRSTGRSRFMTQDARIVQRSEPADTC